MCLGANCRWAAPLILLAGCAGAGFPEIVDPQEIGSSLGGPSIDRVRDAGNVRLPGRPRR